LKHIYNLHFHKNLNNKPHKNGIRQKSITSHLEIKQEVEVQNNEEANDDGKKDPETLS
jgi:hypothetical protein